MPAMRRCWCLGDVDDFQVSKLVRERCFAKGYPFATPQEKG